MNVNLNSSLICTAKTCTCSAYQINNNGACLDCNVPNCLLCSVDNKNECDVCKSGFILDKLTHTVCLAPLNSILLCTAQQAQCGPYQVKINN